MTKPIPDALRELVTTRLRVLETHIATIQGELDELANATERKRAELARHKRDAQELLDFLKGQ